MKNQQFVKLLLIGDSGVGKSCILKRYVHNTFTSGFYNTIGVEFVSKQIQINKLKCKLQIWDTAGQERFRSITSNYYRRVDGILLIFDITDKESFKDIDFWIQQIARNADPNSLKILIGNKCDLVQKRQVSEQQAYDFATKKGLEYIEASALNSANVNLVFETITKKILNTKEPQSNSVNKKQLDTVQKVKLNVDQTAERIKNQCC